MVAVQSRKCIAFDQLKRVASGSLTEVARDVKEYLKKHPKAAVLIFDETTSEPVEVDFRGSVDAVLKRLEPTEEPADLTEKKPGPGRPRLGVVAKEVTLLPEHWDWLGRQPGGASVTLRKLVEEARKKHSARDRVRQAQDAAYKFMTAMAGNLEHYEEALRALFAKDAAKFEQLISDWPKDIREHTSKLAKAAL